MRHIAGDINPTASNLLAPIEMMEKWGPTRYIDFPSGARAVTEPHRTIIETFWREETDDYRQRNEKRNR